MRDAIVEIHCPFCGCVHTVEVNEDAYYDWQEGMLIQNAMPDLTPTEREQLISKLCPDCQDKIFGAEDEDYEPADIDDDCGFDPYMGCYTDDC